MAEIKLTKNALRAQQHHLSQLEKYLPTLQLKKAMLQAEVQEARLAIQACEQRWKALLQKAQAFAGLLTEHTVIDPLEAAKVASVERSYENIAGVEVPQLESIAFVPITYNLFETPPWVDRVVLDLQGLAEARIRLQVAQEKKEALENELRQVAIRVNLFEKVLIPRAERNIKKIKVFLGDQELSAVGRAKVAKGKIEQRRSTSHAR